MGYFLFCTVHKNCITLLELWILPFSSCGPHSPLLYFSYLCHPNRWEIWGVILACSFLFLPSIIGVQVSAYPVTLASFFPLHPSQYIQMQGLIISYWDYYSCFLSGLIPPPLVLKCLILTPVLLAATIIVFLKYGSHHAMPSWKCLNDFPLTQHTLVPSSTTPLPCPTVSHLKVYDYYLQPRLLRVHFFFSDGYWNQPVCKRSMFSEIPLFPGKQRL